MYILSDGKNREKFWYNYSGITPLWSMALKEKVNNFKQQKLKLENQIAPQNGNKT